MLRRPWFLVVAAVAVLAGAWLAYEYFEVHKLPIVVEPDEDVLEDAVAFAGVSKYPARIKCALLAWMAWKDATARALGEKDE